MQVKVNILTSEKVSREQWKQVQEDLERSISSTLRRKIQTKPKVVQVIIRPGVG